jgi:hypothetical protein
VSTFIGFFIIGLAALGVILLAGVISGHEKLESIGFGGIAVWCLIVLVFLGFWAMTAPPAAGPVEGSCYRAFGKDVMVGKVMTRKVELVEIECP